MRRELRAPSGLLSISTIAIRAMGEMSEFEGQQVAGVRMVG